MSFIKGLFEDKKTKQSANVAPNLTMKNTGNSYFGLFKGLFKFKHLITSAFVIIPEHGEASQSLIDPYGTATTSMMLSSGVATTSRITGSSGTLSLIDNNGMAITSEINPAGLATESNV